MAYKVAFLEEAAKDWLSLDRSVRQKLEKSIERLKTDPQSYGKPLGGNLHGLRRIRSGDYRIVYLVRESTKTVDIGVICHRGDVYQIALQRRLA